MNEATTQVLKETAHGRSACDISLLKYDIVDLNRPMNPELRESIKKEGICFYARSTTSLTVL